VKESILQWEGSLHVQSIINEGTVFTLELPKASAPYYFVTELPLVRNSTVVVLDDDDAVKVVWEQRMIDEIRRKNIHFEKISIGALLSKIISENSNLSLCLIDYELYNQEQNGLQLIINHGIQSKSILVTSKWEEEAILEQCKKEKIRVLPKELAGFIPLKLADTSEDLDPDFVVIDDNPMVELTCTQMAIATGKKVYVYDHVEKFNRIKLRFKKSTPIYVDYYLNGESNPIRGDQVTLGLSQEGFKNLFIFTGEDPNVLPEMPWAILKAKNELPWYE
jgi:hypothetical protein